jgi:hypothetical protein
MNLKTFAQRSVLAGDDVGRTATYGKFEELVILRITASCYLRIHIDQLRPLRANICETVLVLLINERGEKEKGRDERKFS